MKNFMYLWSLLFAVNGLIGFVMYAFLVENAPDERWHTRLLSAFVGLAVFTILDEIEKLKK